MAEIRRAHKVLQVFMVATLLAVAVWVNDPHAQASEASGTSCSSADFTIDDAKELVPFYWGDARYAGSPGYYHPAGGIHVTVPSAGAIHIVDTLKADPEWGSGLNNSAATWDSGTVSSAGTYGVDVGSVLSWSRKGREELVRLSKGQESLTVDYEVTFQPYENGSWGYESCPKTTSIKYVPAKAEYDFWGCGFTIQDACYETEISLSIKDHVWSGELSEPAGGTRCSISRKPVIGFQKLQADGTWKSVSGFGEVKAKGGSYSVTIKAGERWPNGANRIDKKTARLFSKGTFRTWLPYAELIDDSLEGTHLCGPSASTPVKI